MPLLLSLKVFKLSIECGELEYIKTHKNMTKIMKKQWKQNQGDVSGVLKGGGTKTQALTPPLQGSWVNVENYCQGTGKTKGKNKFAKVKFKYVTENTQKTWNDRCWTINE